MTIRATLIGAIEDIISAQAALSEEERRLQARRIRLEASMHQAIVALADLESASTPEAAEAEGPPFVPALPRKARTKVSAKLQISARRRYMDAAMRACREIILAFGRPMTIAEIHAAHPARSRLPQLALGKALDGRARSPHPAVLGRNGVYWVADRALPEGWIHPKGTPWVVVPIPYRAKAKRRVGSAKASRGAGQGDA